MTARLFKELAFAIGLFLVLALMLAPGTAHAVVGINLETGETTGDCVSQPGEPLSLDDLQTVQEVADVLATGDDELSALDASSDQKTIPLLAIVVGFTNVAYDDAIDWNKHLFSGYYGATTYFNYQSDGKFTFLPAAETCGYTVENNVTNTFDQPNDGIVHVTLEMAHENWTDHSITFYQAMVQALAAAEQYVDFSAYDANKDGAIDRTELGICFVMAGYEAAVSGNQADEALANTLLWSHQWAFFSLTYFVDCGVPAKSMYESPSGVTIDYYLAIAEHMEPGKASAMSTVAHELTHFLGIVDLYNTETDEGYENDPWAKYEVNYTSLMATSWGYIKEEDGSSTYVPQNIDGWSKSLLGWVEASVVSDGSVALNSSDTDNYSVVMVLTDNPNEYYVLENRQFVDYDACLANVYPNMKGGIVLWHVDTSAYEHNENTINSSQHRPTVMPVYAEKVSAEDTTYTTLGTLPNLGYFCYTSESMSQLTEGLLQLTSYNQVPLRSEQDTPAYRTLSGITVRVDSVNASSMQVTIGGGVYQQLARTLAFGDDLTLVAYWTDRVIPTGCVTLNGQPMAWAPSAFIQFTAESDEVQGVWVLLCEETADYDFAVDEEGQRVTVAWGAWEDENAKSTSGDLVIGDVNGSGAMNVVDAQIAYDIACGKYAIPQTMEQQCLWLSADVNEVLGVDAGDAFAIQRALHYGWE